MSESSAVSAVLRTVRTALEEAKLTAHDLLVVGYSGGPDSLALLWSLQHLARRGHGPQLLPVHVDHRLHRDSQAMAARAIALGRILGVEILVRVVDVTRWPAYREAGVEAGARAARYAALASVACESGTRWIAVAHTRDDQAETLLLRLLRGAGLDGLAAMRPVTELRVPLDPEQGASYDVRVLRPLLRVRRTVIEAALAALSLEPLRDPTNELLAFQRNAVRHRLLPVLEEFQPDIIDTLAQVAEQLQDDASYLRSEGMAAYARLVQRDGAFLSIDREEFRGLHPALQRRVLQIAVSTAYDPSWTLSRERTLAVRAAVLHGRPGTRLELGRGIAALVSYTEIVLGPAERIEDYLRARSGQPLLAPGTEVVLRSGLTVPLENGWRLSVRRAPDSGWVLRTRRPGDRLVRGQGQPPVRLQDWLVNRKIPGYLRDWLPLVATDGVVHWIVGIESARYTSPDETLVLAVTKSEEAMQMSEPGPMPAGELERVLIDEATLQRRVAELGEAIAREYRGKRPVLIGVLTGAFVFMADLIRHLPIDLDIDFMAVSSYGQATVTSGVVRIMKDLDRPIEGRDVLLVEDIVDSGLTLQYLLDVLQRRNPRSLRVVVLLRKQKPEAVTVPVDWIGFEIPDEFVVGYGLDAAGRFRNLPFIAVYRRNN
ncbi:MAG: hypoxanthine phosphoribosyltransferase [Thermomicrobium sp.]|nr:hypoxanthine phosphoribosyltransferase [Thermomicrobium sp.]